jgi:hypothetical protein
MTPISPDTSFSAAKAVEDLSKAAWYLSWEIENRKGAG